MHIKLADLHRIEATLTTLGRAVLHSTANGEVRCPLIESLQQT
jgi:hypothetical protein